MANKTRYRSQMKGSVSKETVTHTIDTGHKTKLASSFRRLESSDSRVARSAIAQVISSRSVQAWVFQASCMTTKLLF